MTDQSASSVVPARVTALARAREIVFSGPLVTIAAGILLIIVLSALLAQWIVPHDPVRLSPGVRLKPPSEEFWLGTDAYGRDLFSRIIYGGRISLVVGVAAAIFAVDPADVPRFGKMGYRLAALNTDPGIIHAGASMMLDKARG